jgi:diguanylate cyclase (GGDEF)-like protein/PAS domain S-box-containing protein
MKKKTSPPSNADPANLLAGQDLRSQAELKLSEREKKAAVSPVTKADFQRLVHELQVHQIELEMQGEELAQSRAELEWTLSMYTELYAFAPVGYFTLMQDGTIRRANITGAKLLGVELSNMIKRRFGIFLSPSSRPTFNTFLEQVFISENKEVCDVNIEKDGSVPLWVHIEGIRESSLGQGEMCYAIVSDITERKQAEEELKHLSTHDALTGLYNRGFFVAEMERLERGRVFPISILMADVDHLKETNDQEGHAAGDALLKRSAQVLTAAFRVEDVIARIGGDEFAVLLPDTNAASAQISLQRVRQMIQDTNAAHTETLIRLSLGVSTAETSMPLSVVLKKADENMYREKRGNDDTEKNQQ